MSAQSMQKVLEDTFQQNYLRFFEIAEGRRRWNLFTDIPWDQVNPQAPEHLGAFVEQFCGVELYLPDYTSKLIQMMRRSRGRGWFLANWGYEESKHSLTLEMWLTRSGKRTAQNVQDFSDVILEREWELPFATARQMMVYTMIQELATHINYKQLRGLALQEGDPALATALRYIAADEMAHFGFYRDTVKVYLALDEDNTRADIAYVFKHFAMPALSLVPEAEQRGRELEALGLYGPRQYVKLVKEPIEKALGLGNVRQLQRQYLDVAGRPRSFPVPECGTAAE